MFMHSLLPFRRVKAGNWSIICLDCCTVTYDFSMTKGVTTVSQDHRGEVRVFPPMEVAPVVATKARAMLG